MSKVPNVGGHADGLVESTEHTGGARYRVLTRLAVEEEHVRSLPGAEREPDADHTLAYLVDVVVLERRTDHRVSHLAEVVYGTADGERWGGVRYRLEADREAESGWRLQDDVTLRRTRTFADEDLGESLPPVDIPDGEQLAEYIGRLRDVHYLDVETPDLETEREELRFQTASEASWGDES